MQSAGETLFRYYEINASKGVKTLLRSKEASKYPIRYWHQLSQQEKEMWEKVANPMNVIDWRTA